MNTDYTAKITEIFYSVDEVCKQIEPQFKKKRMICCTSILKVRQKNRATLVVASTKGYMPH